MKQLIECVPNISEGRDREKIDQITSVVETVEGVRLLDVDPGQATNRTVITFVGEPEPVIEPVEEPVDSGDSANPSSEAEDDANSEPDAGEGDLDSFGSDDSDADIDSDADSDAGKGDLDSFGSDDA